MITVNNDYYLVTGIYKITCTGNNKSYIGSSVNITERWRQHLSHLRAGTHHSPYLQRSYNKYGEDSLEFKVIAVLEESNEIILRTLEFIYIEQLHPEFNCTSPEERNCGLEWRRKISETTRRLYESGYKNPRLDTGRKYKVLHYTGKLVASNISIRRVAELVGAKDYHFFNTCLKKHDYITTWNRGEFVIMGIDKTRDDLLNFYRSLSIKNIAMCDSNNILYLGKLTNRQKRLKKCVSNSQNFLYMEDNVIYTFPCLQSDAVI